MEKTIYTKCLVDQSTAYIPREHIASVFLLKDWGGWGRYSKISGVWNAWKCQILTHRGHSLPGDPWVASGDNADQRAGSGAWLPVLSLQEHLIYEKKQIKWLKNRSGSDGKKMKPLKP